MEEYSDLKFDGDLSFLNENLDAAKFAEREANIKQEIVKEEYAQSAREEFNKQELARTESVKFTNANVDKIHEQNEFINEPVAQINPESTQKTVEHMENRNETMNSEALKSARDNDNTSSGMAKQNFQQTGEKKSQLEEMILNSGYGAEMFNNLKMELLEMEKEKIIMKYKQDLMMMIIKS